MLWLAAYLTGFPPVGLHALSWTHCLAPMWSKKELRQFARSCATLVQFSSFFDTFRKEQ